jgi:hypothetical protein
MSDWKVTEKHWDASGDIAEGICTFGLTLLFNKLTDSGWRYIYTVEDEDGNEKKVAAKTAHELGERIADGDFMDLDE